LQNDVNAMQKNTDAISVAQSHLLYEGIAHSQESENPRWGLVTVTSSFLEFVSATSGAKARTSLNRVFWNWFWRSLEAKPQGHQIDSPRNGFVDFWRQAPKVIKSDLLGLVLSTSGANAKKSPNGAFRSSLGRFPDISLITLH
jgi:hypothetical protein